MATWSKAIAMIKMCDRLAFAAFALSLVFFVNQRSFCSIKRIPHLAIFWRHFFAPTFVSRFPLLTVLVRTRPIASTFVSWQMYDEMKKVDKLLGEFIQQLEDHGIRNKTNIIIVGDHGMETGVGKEWVYITEYLPKNSWTYMGPSGAFLQVQPKKGKLKEV